MSNVILSIKNVTKTYPGVIALNNYSMDFEKGEVHALLGENGAGKSTLIKIISGAIEPDRGEIIFGDKVFTKLTPHLAIDLGVEVIYQEFSLVESISVAKNVFLGSEQGFITNLNKIIKQFCYIIDLVNIIILRHFHVHYFCVG